MIMGLFLACLCILIALWFTCTLNVMVRSTACDNKLADIKLITPDDFGASITLNNDLYDVFKKNREPLEQGQAMIVEFENAIIKEIESHLRSNQLIPEDEDDDPDGKVAKINFSFNNREVLMLLAKRANYLAELEFGKAKEIEDEISDLYKSHQYDSLVKPKNAFVIFETEKGLESVTIKGSSRYKINCKAEYFENGEFHIAKA
jgi:hypothetical protein